MLDTLFSISAWWNSSWPFRPFQELASQDDAEVDLWLDRIEAAGALTEASWFATTARDRERFRHFRHSLAELVNDAVRRNGALSTEFVPAPALFKYVAVDELPRITGKEGSDELWSKTLPLSLNVWLQHLAAIPANAIFEVACEEVHQ